MKRIILLLLFIPVIPIHASVPCLTLENVWDLVMNNHEQVKSLCIENYQAELNIRQTLRKLLPCVGATASVTFSNPTKVVDGSRLIPTCFKAGSLKVSQSVIDFRFRPCYLAAQRAKEATYNNSTFELYEILYLSSEVFIAALQSNDLLRVSEHQLSLVEQQLEVVQERYEKGEVPITDLLRSEEEVNRIRRVLNDVSSDALIYREQLSNLINRDPCSYQLIPPVDLDQGEPDLCSLIEELPKRRKDLKSIAFSVEVAKQQIRALKRTNWPRLDFLGEYTLASPETLGFRNNSWSAGLCLNMPIFDGGMNCLNIKNAEAELTKQQLLYDRMCKDLKVKVKSAYYELTSAKANCALLENALGLSQENYQILSDRYKRGQATNIDLMNALNDYIEVQATYAIAKYNLILLNLKLKKETGFFDELFDSKCLEGDLFS